MKNWSLKRKLVLFLLILLAATLIIGSLSDSPSPTLEIAMRRMEKRMLVGPMETITTLDFEYSPWDHLVIGKSAYGYSIYDYCDDLGWDNGDLAYFPRSEDVTIICPEYPYRTADNKSFLPIFLFPEDVFPAQAKMTLIMSIDNESETCTVEADRIERSLFLFSLPVDDIKPEYFWLLQQAVSGNCREYVLTGTVEISVEFYDASGNFIDAYTKTVTI